MLRSNPNDPTTDPAGGAQASRSAARLGSFRSRPSRLGVAGAALSAALLVGCSSGDDVNADGSDQASARSSESSVSTEPGSTESSDSSGSGDDTRATIESTVAPEQLVGASTETKSGEPSSPDMSAAALTGVRMGSHDGYERIVFEFRDTLPGYEVGYLTEPPVEDGSGDPIELKGTSVLAIRIHPASGVDMESDDYEQTYKGSTRIAGVGNPVRELVRSGDFEAQLQWVVGMDREQPFVVSTLTSPPRIVIDVES